MKVQEIFNLPAVKSIEEDIISIYLELEHNRGRSSVQRESTKECIKELLEVRKDILDHEFVMDSYYKRMLEEFNESMKIQLLKMRNETIKAYNAIKASGIIHDIEAVGKCFMGYCYSPIHPVQTTRAKRIWDIMNGSLDDFVSLYFDGIVPCGWRYSGGKPESENMFLYLDEKPDNWNEGLDKEMTKDMNLTNAFHSLYDHTSFSIFDLLWVRDFAIEISTEYDYKTYDEETELDNWDWNND